MRKKIKNNNIYWLYGKHPVDSAINNSSRIIYKLLVTKNTNQLIDKYKAIIQDKNIEVEVLTNNEISEEIDIQESVHQGVAIQVKKLELTSIEKLLKTVNENSTILFLDQITDPQNIGAIIRSSLGFNVDAVITTKDNAPSENSTLVKSSAGAFEYIPYIQVTNISRTLNELKENGYWIASIVQNGTCSIQEIAKFNKLALIMGSEGKGVRDINLKQSDMTAKIEISPKLESLNVSNATAIVLHQLYILNNKK
jgi:23S rRNA (guanosine2251-2'-O)-methyltransferase